MSRSNKDGKVHGTPAAGEGTKNRGVGHEWSSTRDGKGGYSQTGPETKRKTHRAERRIGKKVIKHESEDT